MPIIVDVIALFVVVVICSLVEFIVANPALCCPSMLSRGRSLIDCVGLGSDFAFCSFVMLLTMAVAVVLALVYVYFFVFLSFVVTTGATDRRKRLVSEVTFYVSNGTLNIVYSFSQY